MIFEFVQLNGPLVEHLLKRVVLLDEFQFLILAHLLYLDALDIHVVGLLESARVGHHCLADHVAALQFFKHCGVVVLETVFSEFLLDLYLLDGLSEEGELGAIEILIAFVCDVS